MIARASGTRLLVFVCAVCPAIHLPMTVRVLLFGAEARLADAPQVEVRVPDAALVCDVRDALAAQHPALAASMAHARLARNHAFARPDEPVAAGDELALIGLVSGG